MATSRRVRRARLETLMGMLSFFLVVFVGIALVDWFQTPPSAWPSVVAAGLAGLLAYAYVRWKRM